MKHIKKHISLILIMAIALTLFSVNAVAAKPFINTKSVTIRAQLQYTRTAISSTGATVKYKSSDISVVTVNQSGKIVGVKPGTATTYLKGKVNCKSSNIKVAVVDQNGKVTAKAVGTAVITATSGTGSAKYTVNVVNSTTSNLDTRSEPHMNWRSCAVRFAGRHTKCGVSFF